jgi:chromosome segregation ATPase
MATRSRTKADLEVIIANQRADIDALEQRSKDWLDQHEKIGDDWNRALNRVAELEKQLVRIASEKQAELDNLQAELRVAQNEAVTLRARVSELWRAFTHVTSAYAAKQ